VEQLERPRAHVCLTISCFYTGHWPWRHGAVPMHVSL
jgi:hypothetical protein